MSKKATFPDDELTTADVAKARKVSKANVVLWIKNGLLPAVLKFGRYIIRRADLDAFTPRKAGRPLMTEAEKSAAHASKNGKSRRAISS